MDDELLLEQEEAMVNGAFHHLIESYLATKHRKKIDIITKAFNFAKHAHKGVRRLSGEPYIMHPLAVAQIVCTEIGLGSTSICSALLHDVVEDTDYTVEDIENIFGPKIAQIVDGLTKISGGIFGEHASAQAENFKKLLLTMSDDIRVILVKIADRLHNMRTLGSQPVNKRYKIAGETLYIYAPLANRLGLNAIKSELENLSFKYEHPDEYQLIETKLADTEKERNTVFDEFTAPIRERLDQMNLKYEIKARVKSPYSIWHKMQTKHIPFEEIYDILAVRIVFQVPEAIDEKIECFNIYVALSKIYSSHPDRLRDWVNQPKSNGYQALHVTLMSNKGEWIEVQIRSQRMDEIAEKGFAAHWKYKDGDKGENASETELDKWLVTIKEILDDPQPDAMDFLDTIKLNLFASEIFVFTPKGDIRTLPAGCTALDFAFSIHTFIGSHCIGAKVNHKLVPMSHKLNSGDQVEILTSRTKQVNRSWLDIVTTAKATTKIMAIVRREEREARRVGEEQLASFLEQSDVKRDTLVIERLCELHGVNKPDELYLAIGQGKITLGSDDVSALKGKDSPVLWKKLFSLGLYQKRNKQKADGFVEKKEYDRKKTVIITEGDINKDIFLADCCSPIPGDSVMAFIDDAGNIQIHKLDCPVAGRLKASAGNRVLAAKWNCVQNTLEFPVTIQMNGIDNIGVLNSITEVISHGFNANIRRLELETNDGVFMGKVTLLVHNMNEVKSVLSDLKKIKDIKEVMRI